MTARELLDAAAALLGAAAADGYDATDDDAVLARWAAWGALAAGPPSRADLERLLLRAPRAPASCT